MNAPRSWIGWIQRGLVLVALIGGIGVPAMARGGEETGASEADGRVPGPACWVMALSPYLDASAKEAAFRHVVRFLVTQMPVDSSLTLLDGYRLRTVARILIPDREAFRSEKTRLNQFSDALRETKRFLATNEVRAPAGPLSFGGALRVPQLLDFISEHLVPPGREVRVVLLGSPLYVDDKEPSFSMAAGYFPSDAHLAVTRERSVYGTQERGGCLSRVVVDWGYFGDPWVSEVHRERVERFWRLFVARQGGVLRTVATDLPTVFAATLGATASGGAERTMAAEGAAVPGKLEMIRVTRATDSLDWIRGDRVLNPAEGPPARSAGRLKIGIRWQDDVDFDLYARPASGRERLSFEHPRSPDGYYFKDHRTSPGSEFEFVEFTEPVDVRELEVFVNLYEGRLREGAGGEVRLEFEGRTYASRFHVEAREGNQGREGRGQSRWWARIEVPRVLGLGLGVP
ncbi:MAG: hypothetical protein IT580_11845 [Verrucomicrobiales bacterium]|nr:hypothetical protein [Verrucomicrobiales bacterium]